MRPTAPDTALQYPVRSGNLRHPNPRGPLPSMAETAGERPIASDFQHSLPLAVDNRSDPNPPQTPAHPHPSRHRPLARPPNRAVPNAANQTAHQGLICGAGPCLNARSPVLAGSTNVSECPPTALPERPSAAQGTDGPKYSPTRSRSSVNLPRPRPPRPLARHASHDPPHPPSATKTRFPRSGSDTTPAATLLAGQCRTAALGRHRHSPSQYDERSPYRDRHHDVGR